MRARMLAPLVAPTGRWAQRSALENELGEDQDHRPLGDRVRIAAASSSRRAGRRRRRTGTSNLGPSASRRWNTPLTVNHTDPRLPVAGWGRPGASSCTRRARASPAVDRKQAAEPDIEATDDSILPLPLNERWLTSAWASPLPGSPPAQRLRWPRLALLSPPAASLAQACPVPGRPGIGPAVRTTRGWPGAVRGASPAGPGLASSDRPRGVRSALVARSTSARIRRAESKPVEPVAAPRAVTTAVAGRGGGPAAHDDGPALGSPGPGGGPPRRRPTRPSGSAMGFPRPRDPGGPPSHPGPPDERQAQRGGVGEDRDAASPAATVARRPRPVLIWLQPPGRPGMVTIRPAPAQGQRWGACRWAPCASSRSRRTLAGVLLGRTQARGRGGPSCRLPASGTERRHGRRPRWTPGWARTPTETVPGGSPPWTWSRHPWRPLAPWPAEPPSTARSGKSVSRTLSILLDCSGLGPIRTAYGAVMGLNGRFPQVTAGPAEPPLAFDHTPATATNVLHSNPPA